MKFLTVILLCLFSALSLCGEAVLVIKGKSSRASLKVQRQKGIVFRRSNATAELGVRTRKNFQRTKVEFKVLRDDEFVFSFGGGFTRNTASKKNKFEWIDCTLLKVNDLELIGPNAGKDVPDGKAAKGDKSVKDTKNAKGGKAVKGVKTAKGGKAAGKEAEKITTVGPRKALKGSVKVRKGDTLKVEMIVRATSRDEAKKRFAEGSMTERQKARMQKEAEKEKIRAAEREKAEKERQAVAARNREVLEKRYGVKNNNKTQTSTAKSATAAPEKTEEGPGGDDE
jgi:hypothetical protein